MRKEIFVEGEFYHVFSRSIERRILFSDIHEITRFIHTAYVVNNFAIIPPRFDLISLEPQKFLIPIKPNVKIVAGCVMPTHFHFMVSPIADHGLSKFMHRLCLSYSRFYNLKYERKGRVFESTFKAKPVDKDNYATYLTQYIHLNPVSLYHTKYGTENGFEMIKGYKWSSLPVYLGKESPFSLLVSNEFRNDVLGMNEKEYEDILKDLYNELYHT